ncbi:MAG: LytR C-terminal domain-containing protein [Gammaproteobacteria bacterium]|nr:LytR C-terminal domain-containing protein [Gammaproteobacteria bacterium]
MKSNFAPEAGSRLLLFITILILCTTVTHAATNSRMGGSGLSWMRTADIQPHNDFSIYQQTGMDTFNIVGANLNDYDLFATFGINYGLADYVELGLLTSYVSNDENNTSGIRHLKATAKLRFLGSEKEGYAAAIFAFATGAVADIEDRLGSEEAENGAELNLSFYGEDANFHISYGSATADYREYVPELTFRSIDKDVLAIAAEFKLSRAFTLGIEGISESSDDLGFDENQLFALSLQYHISNEWQLDIGSAFGVPEDRAEPVKSFYLGINYSPGKQPVRRRAQHESNTRSVKAVQTVTPPQQVVYAPVPNVASAPKKTSKPVKKLTKKKGNNIRIKLVNVSGSESMEQRARDFLISKGYTVLRTKRLPGSKDKTEIYHTSKRSRDALNLALKIPGSQNLRKVNHLESGIDLELRIGSDILHQIR